MLTRGKLLIFSSEADYECTSENGKKKSHKYGGAAPSQIIDMTNVASVCSHYDTNAPKKSKKLGKTADLDMSRFDIYLPGRTYHLKACDRDTKESIAWIRGLKESLIFYS